jgi:hypothetical protein
MVSASFGELSRIGRNASLSMTSSSVSSMASTLALRCSPVISDISPKNWSGPSCATSTSPRLLLLTITRTRPLRMMKSSWPTSPSQMMRSPLANSWLRAPSTRRTLASSGSAARKST